MKTFRLISIVFLLALLAAACGREASGRMDIADSLMTERPDSALEILRSVTPEMRSGRAQEARYDMLLTDALYRCDADSLLSDSVIGVAVDYYERRDDAPAAARAHYLAGIVDSKAQRNTDAAVHMLMAEKFALQDSTDHFLAGLVYRGLANCYEEFYELETAREYLIKAYGEFLKTDSLLHAGYVAVQASRRSLDLLEYDEITRYAKSATDIARKIGNDNLLTAAKITEARAYVRQRKYGDAIELYEELLTYESNEFIEEDYMNLGLAYLMTGENELADQCNANVSSYESGFNTIELNRLIIEGDTHKANDLLLETVEKLDSVRNTVWTRNNIAAVNNFYKRQDRNLTESVKKAKAFNWYILIGCILILTLAATTFLYLRQRAKKSLLQALNDAELLKTTLSNTLQERDRSMLDNERTLSEKEDAILSMRTSLDRSDEENKTLKAHVSELERRDDELSADLDRLKTEEAHRMSQERRVRKDFGKQILKRFAIIDTMLDTYYKFKGSASELESLGKSIQKELDIFIGNGDTLKAFIQTANFRHYGVIDRLRTEFPRLNDTDVTFFALASLGLSNTAIALLIGCPINSVYNRRSKLKGIFETVSKKCSKEFLALI